MPQNKALQQAAKAQQDEFYTDIHNIANELMYYRHYFTEKVNRNLFRWKPHRSAAALIIRRRHSGSQT